jgi:hypothetical protein
MLDPGGFIARRTLGQLDLAAGDNAHGIAYTAQLTDISIRRSYSRGTTNRRRLPTVATQALQRTMHPTARGPADRGRAVAGPEVLRRT